MKQFSSICILLALLVISASCGGNTTDDASTSQHTASETTTSQTSTETSYSSTERYPDSKELLQKYEAYSLYGVVFGMPMEDVYAELGILEISERADIIYGGTDGLFLDYKNMIITVSEDAEVPHIVSMSVVEGTYLGLTIGESTKADVDAFLGIQEGDRSFVQYSDDPTIIKVRSDYKRDGAGIVVFLENDIVVRVSSISTRE